MCYSTVKINNSYIQERQWQCKSHTKRLTVSTLQLETTEEKSQGNKVKISQYTSVVNNRREVQRK